MLFDLQKMKTVFPMPGQRIVRSMLAVLLCIIIYLLRGRNGALFYSVIATLQCIQPYTSNMLKMGRNRMIGTLVGAFWGMHGLFFGLWIADGSMDYQTTVIYYMILVVLVGLDLYSTVPLKVTESAYFSTIVFASITINHIRDANPYIFVFNRILDTFIGVLVAVAVNSLHLPRVRDRETLFVANIDNVLFREQKSLTLFTKVQLNRFIQDNMRFSITTKETPATVRELTKGIDLRLPVVAMDGAVLYDMATATYLCAEKMDRNIAKKTTDFLMREEIPYFVNTLEENLSVIFCRGFSLNGSGNGTVAAAGPAGAGAGASPSVTVAAAGPAGAGTEKKTAADAMRALYMKKKNSPYRNYVSTDKDVVDNVLCFMFIDRKERVKDIYGRLMEQPWTDGIRAEFDTFDCREEEAILRVYSSRASRRAMLEKLRKNVGASHIMLCGTDKEECDVVIPNGGGNNLVKKLKKYYEPVSVKGWRNIIHF